MTETGHDPAQIKKSRRSRMWRINLYFFAVFTLFAALIVKLGLVQIVNGEEYERQASKTEAKIASYPAPRGKMYDRNGRVVVDNQSVPAITYTVTSNTKTKEKISTAKKLAKLIDIDTSFLKERDLKDYWLAAHPKKAEALLSKDEKKLESSKTYALQVDRVPAEEIAALKKDKQELETAAFFRRFSGGYAYEPQIVKSMNPKTAAKGDAQLLDEKTSKQQPARDLTYEEVSRVSEHLEELPGVDVIMDWTRKYPYEKTLHSIFGGVTTPEQGLLKERQDFYLTRGYARNDRVGKSYLEYQYEEYLNPKKAKVQYTENRSGEVVSQKTVDEGRRGYDLQLTFDIELQKKVEEAIEEELNKFRGSNYMLDRAFVVMMDPNNGDILSMAGKRIIDGKITDYAIGTFTTQYEMGSAVKGATVLAGYQDGMPHGQSYYDSGKLKFAGPVKKGSYTTSIGWADEVRALEKSSNVYMFYVAMRMAGITYTPGGPLPADLEDLKKMRYYYNQFGLGVKTGIDLPQESAGMQTNPKIVGGLLLDEAIGQFDTYTPLQLAQYVSTIANGGYRVQPRVVKSILQPESEKLGPVIEERSPNVLNRINNSQSDIAIVKQGFKRVTQTGTAAGAFGSLDVSGKTGTAETNYYGTNRNWWGTPTYNITFAGYYPSENPQVAFSVVVPSVDDKTKMNKNIAAKIVKAYVDLQKKYSKD
ncbi:peptidoglycan D,D-transpeptidase FtsI family protein [Bacillus glycinifermentans]|uniref:serine-type D-Ala-D-Ala carboxypeptidase n=1 Tax=Bacillus glycinifermentans TaxID=1664069 RepID=A0A0T6BPC9_9BACI|nr:penicillin-binding protein 2 [Bacillus glycinifermentans]ATH91213.1 penicillin-binding protein 2 [Bacillus glycinifermentans]KRT93503.1 penicillin-binding protein [Bacillus glycinifermentans]MEC0485491.1 penicillin-binding protein 2 [Bacillus glycinifermentans]